MSAGAALSFAVLRGPSAGRGRHARAVDQAMTVLRDAGATLLDATDRDQALAQCHAAVAGGIPTLVVVGGDGTVHLGVQAVAGTRAALGIVPAGTGNDFAIELGLSPQPARAATAIVTALRTGARTRPVDLARVEGDDGYRGWFAAVLAAGFDALVNERANGMRWPRGPRRYDLAILAELLRLRARRYRLYLDGEAQEVDAMLVAVANTASYGGGMRICPQADPQDGKLDVLVGGPISRTTLVRLQPRLYSGTHVRHPQVRTLRAASVRIEAAGITAYADGERLCPLPVTLTAVPGALNLLAGGGG